MQSGCANPQTNGREPFTGKLTLIGGNISQDKRNVEPASRLIKRLEELLGVLPGFHPDSFIPACRSIKVEHLRVFPFRFQLARQRMRAVRPHFFGIKGDQHDGPLRREGKTWQDAGQFEQHRDCRRIIGRPFMSESAWIIAQGIIMRSYEQGLLGEPLVCASELRKHIGPTNLARNQGNAGLQTRTNQRWQKIRAHGEHG
jgi:hypothetical protein